MYRKLLLLNFSYMDVCMYLHNLQFSYNTPAENVAAAAQL